MSLFSEPGHPARPPDYRITLAGRRISPELDARLMRLRLTDHRGLEADQLDIGSCQATGEGTGGINQPQRKGGSVARQAAMLCQDPAFRLYLDRRRRHKHGLAERDLPDGTHNEQDARDWLCAACGIQSRAELDHDVAAALFTCITQRFQH